MSDQQERRQVAVVYTRTERSRDEAVLAVNGPLTDEAAEDFKLQLEGLISGRWPIVSLDLSLVKGISSQCLGKIVLLKMRLEEHGRTFRIRGCDPGLYEQFRKISYDRIIDIQP